MRRLLAAAFAMLVAIVGLSLTTASAATLDVATAPQLFVAQEAACGPGTINGNPVIGAAATPPGTAGTYTGITLSNIPTDCQGLDLPVDVFVHTTAGGLISSGSGIVGTGTTSVGVGGYTGSAVTTVVVRIGGWLFPTNWTAPAPVALPPATCVPIDASGNPTSGACMVNIGTVNYWDAGTPYHHMQVNYEVSSSENRWEVTFNFASDWWPSGPFTPTFIGSSHNVMAAPGYSCSSLPVFRAWKRVGNVAWDNGGSMFVTNHPTTTNGAIPVCS